jgi:hypothetical protein
MKLNGSSKSISAYSNWDNGKSFIIKKNESVWNDYWCIDENGCTYVAELKAPFKS